ncbi:MAG: immunoglobulin-like domain-containing protein [bacterium]
MRRIRFYDVIIVTALIITPVILWSQINTWQQTNLTNGVVWYHSFSISESGIIYAGTNIGAYRSTDNGATWTQVNSGLTNTNVECTAVNSLGYAYAGTEKAGIFRSLDKGDNWVPVNNGLTNMDVLSMAIKPSGEIFAGTDQGGIFRSSNNGNSWNQLNNGLIDLVVFDFVFRPDGKIFTAANSVHYSTNNGETWIETSLRRVDGVFCLTANSLGHIFAGTGMGIFRSTDDGVTWAEVGFQNSFILSIVIDEDDKVYAATNNAGVVVSLDNGNHWSPMNDGLMNIRVLALCFNKIGELLAGTNGNGIYKFMRNRPPLANAGDDQILEAVSPQGASISLDGSQSSDPDGDQLTYLWTWTSGSATGVNPIVTLPLGDTEITLTVNDGKGGVDSDKLMVKVIDSKPPVVTLLGPNPMQIEYGSEFVDPGVTVIDKVDPCPSLTVTHNVNTHVLGKYPVLYTATDKSGNSSKVIRAVEVIDTTPPRIVILPFKQLWPPNHEYVEFTITNMAQSVSDLCAGPIDLANVSINSVSSDEPEDAPGNGDGNTLKDMVISSDGKSVQLRAERQGNGNGRVYTVSLSVSDPSGNVATAAYKVFVPRDQGKGIEAVEDPIAYTVLLNRGPNNSIAIRAGDAVEMIDDIPTEYSLCNYPNPFNPSTVIAFTIPNNEYVRLSVFSSTGQLVTTLVNDQRQAGSYRVAWEGKDNLGRQVSSGIYFYQLITANYQRTEKMVLLR